MIQITDMEMPKKCQWDCPFCDDDGGACLVSDIKTSDTERPKDCPLLSAEPCEELYRLITDSNSLMLLENYKTGERTVIEKRLEPCEDVISRKALQIALLDEELDQVQGKSGRELCQIVEALPPVQPEEKVGEWVYDAEIDKTTGHCTKCGHYARYGEKTKWCPDCGAKMKGE